MTMVVSLTSPERRTVSYKVCFVVDGLLDVTVRGRPEHTSAIFKRHTSRLFWPCVFLCLILFVYGILQFSHVFLFGNQPEERNRNMGGRMWRLG